MEKKLSAEIGMKRKRRCDAGELGNKETRETKGEWSQEALKSAEPKKWCSRWEQSRGARWSVMT